MAELDVIRCMIEAVDDARRYVQKCVEMGDTPGEDFPDDFVEQAALNAVRGEPFWQLDHATVEHAIEMSGGGMHVRADYDGRERVYPLAEWIEHHQRDGGRVHKRRIIVVEDWTEVPRG